MGISIYKIKKWYKMMTGKSISHVNQGVGTCYSKTEIAGYYNDLTEKVTKMIRISLFLNTMLTQEKKYTFLLAFFSTDWLLMIFS